MGHAASLQAKSVSVMMKYYSARTSSCTTAQTCVLEIYGRPMNELVSGLNILTHRKQQVPESDL